MTLTTPYNYRISVERVPGIGQSESEPGGESLILGLHASEPQEKQMPNV